MLEQSEIKNIKLGVKYDRKLKMTFWSLSTPNFQILYESGQKSHQKTPYLKISGDFDHFFPSYSKFSIFEASKSSILVQSKKTINVRSVKRVLERGTTTLFSAANLDFWCLPHKIYLITQKDWCNFVDSLEHHHGFVNLRHFCWKVLFIGTTRLKLRINDSNLLRFAADIALQELEQ